ncbi:MAG TPA: polyprenyl synthetase family protein [Thermomicrobiales bacterium]|nr:polyprenyl synthetase family protein [Thermomicrobiales bacterium]
MKLHTPDVFESMKPELDLVEAQLLESARVDFPIVSGLVQDIVRGGGKRLRPLLLLLAARGFAGDRTAAVTAAAGVELLHTASLIHDDSIDRAALRRGQPTLNTQLSSGAVILIGDYLFAQSAILAAATKDPRVVMIFATALADICDGQLRETLDAHRLDQSRESYEQRIYGKTAALFAGASEMGAVIGQAPEAAIAELRALGSDLGMAFQIIDDILDLREGTQTIGKPAGNDLRQGVVTLPVMLFAADLPADSETWTTLEAIISGEETRDARIDEIIAAVRASGALERAEEIAADYAERARERLRVVPDAETRAYLNEMLDLAVVRTS